MHSVTLASRPKNCFKTPVFFCLQVGEKMLTRYPIETKPDGLQTASIGLVYPLSHRNGLRLAAAKNDKLQLKCTAKIGSIYWESVVVETILKRDGYMLESRSSGASGGIFLHHKKMIHHFTPSKSLDTLGRRDHKKAAFYLLCSHHSKKEKALESSSLNL